MSSDDGPPAPPESSLQATPVSAARLVPLYAARTVSKFEPVVSTRTFMLDPGVNRHQPVLPAGAQDGCGSPTCKVAPTLVTDDWNGRLAIPAAFAKSSLAGAVETR